MRSLCSLNKASQVHSLIVPAFASVRYLGIRVKAKNKEAYAQNKEAKAQSKQLPKVIANESIRYEEIKVIDEKGFNHGNMSVAKGLQLAKERKLDLVLVSATASPPVCRLVVLSQLIKEQRKQQSEIQKKERDRIPKEMRYTARIDAQDFLVKTNKVIEFLRAGRPVHVMVSFTVTAWIKEEALRREVMSKIVAQVGVAGVGYCEPSNLRAEGVTLHGTFFPTNTPKPQADVAKTLEKLAAPLRSPIQDSVQANKIEATVAAALGGNASIDTVEAALPPPTVLRKFVSAKAKAAIGAGDTKEDDDLVADRASDTLEVDSLFGGAGGRLKKRQSSKLGKRTTG
jgi:translation initiation factor IF-3